MFLCIRTCIIKPSSQHIAYNPKRKSILMLTQENIFLLFLFDISFHIKQTPTLNNYLSLGRIKDEIIHLFSGHSNLTMRPQKSRSGMLRILRMLETTDDLCCFLDQSINVQCGLLAGDTFSKGADSWRHPPFPSTWMKALLVNAYLQLSDLMLGSWPPWGCRCMQIKEQDNFLPVAGAIGSSFCKRSPPTPTSGSNVTCHYVRNSLWGWNDTPLHLYV